MPDAKAYAIQEGLTRLNQYAHLPSGTIYLCVDNQNALRALSGGPSAGEGYYKEGLKEADILHQKGCRNQGKWTPSHQGITGNETADTLAKAGSKDPPCRWARTTLTWLRARGHRRMREEWQKMYQLPKLPDTKPFAPTRNLSRQSARAICRLRCSLTAIDKTPMRPPTPCECRTAEKSATHTLMDCPNTSAARETFLTNYEGPHTWEAHTDTNCRPKELLRFMATTGLINVRAIVTTAEEARNEGYELGEDI